MTTIILSCSAPREMTLSGKVTPQGQLKLGGNMSGNIPTQTSVTLFDNFEDVAHSVINLDTILLDSVLLNLNKSLIAYAIDPISMSTSFYARYGVYKRFDLGYKYYVGLTGGAHVFDAMYQFLGSTSTFDGESSYKPNVYGSIGIQYSSQSFDLPSYLGLIDLQNILGFELSRKDITVPLILSHSFGKEEEYGSISYGLVYNHSFISYSLQPDNIYEPLDSVIAQYTQNIYDKQDFASFGGFVNLKLGYKYAFVIAGFSTLYQNYGSYQLVNGDKVDLKGFTFIPSLGLQFTIPLNKLIQKKT